MPEEDPSSDGDPAARKKAKKKKKKTAAAPKGDGATGPAKKAKAKAKPARRVVEPIEPDDGGEPADGKALVIVESPAKAKTINKFLGHDYKVMASMGHVRDLPENKLGIDIEHGFEPEYQPIPEKTKVIEALRKQGRGARAIYLACDMDREGEAIAWHVSQLFPRRTIMRRVTFNQITEAAIKRAFEAPRDLDMNKVNAQQARRIVDRLVGYKLSQLLWKKVRRGLSAGRVQSVAVRLVVEREKEIQAFRPVEYWDVDVDLESPRLRALAPPPGLRPEEACRLRANLVRLRGLKLDPPQGRIASEAEAKALDDALRAARFVVSAVDEKERRNNPRPPFITSTLQQAASTELSFGTDRTMRVAQGLYEGVELGREGAVGLITYMRTDSFALAPEAVEEARAYVLREVGPSYLPDKPVAYKRGKLKVEAQEAHEAIRPTSVERTPETVAAFLNPDQLKLYTLIWRRFVACQMAPARFLALSVDVTAHLSPGEGDVAVFRANGQRLLFDGHLRVSGREQQDRLLPAVEAGEPLVLLPPVSLVRKETQPPARYTEASLVKKLESEGIGRPSTYASIIFTIQDRGYVRQVNRALHATTKGIVVTDKLGEFFGDVMDYGFTRSMETNLDRVEGAVDEAASADARRGDDVVAADETAPGEPGDAQATLPALDWRELVGEFYGVFAKDLEKADREMKRVNETPEPSDVPCPKCGSMLVKMYNTREFTRFLGCPRYAEGCKTTVPLDDDGKPLPEVPSVPCPRCGKDLVQKSGRRGRFFACSGYPECKQTFEVGPDGRPLPTPDVAAPCPDCGTPMLVRRGRTGFFLGCPEYPKCRGTLPILKDPDGTFVVGQRGQREQLPQVDVKCPQCGAGMSIKRSRRGPFLGCTKYPKCKATAPLPDDVKLPAKKEPQLTGEACDQCGKPLVLREGRRGPFIACSGYPKCRNTRNVTANV